MNSKKIIALAYIGIHFFTHFWKRLFNFRQRGKAEFLKSYQNDGIFAISADRRAEMPDYSNCMYCKLCDLVCPDFIQNPKLTPPSFLVGSFSRSLTDFKLYDSNYVCTNCQACEDICPKNVPIRQIVDFMKEGKHKLETAA